MNSYLKVSSVETKASEKTGGNYKIVRFLATEFLPNGKESVVGNVEASRTLWPARELEINGVMTRVKADAIYDLVMKGEYFKGTVKSYDTVPYDLNGRTVSRFTTVVFDNENGLLVAARALRQHNSAPIDPETGDIVRIDSASTPVRAKELSQENAPD
jgi:hypothetical protein